MIARHLRTLVLLVGACAPAPAVGAEKLASVDPSEIAFRNGVRLYPKPGVDPVAAATRPGVALVQLPGPVEVATRERLLALGLVLHDYVDPFTYVASVPGESWEALSAMVETGAVRAVTPYPAAARIDRALTADASVELPVDVALLREPSAAERAAIEAAVKIEQEPRGALHFVRGIASSDRLDGLAALEPVLWIGRREPHHTQNIEAGTSTGADYLAALGTTGQGVRVATVDSGIARTGDATQCGGNAGSYHTDIGSGRIADEWDFYNNDATACDDKGHGTHVAGTIGGDGSTDRARAGIAPGVTFLIYKDSGPAGTGYLHFNDALSRAASHDADIVGNSWGGGNGVYDTDSYNADAAVRGTYTGSGGAAHPMTLTIAAGNDFDLVVSPGTAKNAVTVGAYKGGNYADDSICALTNNCSYSACSCATHSYCGDHYWPPTERICFSNYGPIDTDSDGRLRVKPDLVAPGTRAFSTWPPYFSAGISGYHFLDGTSMAQPVVAGTAALMIEAHPEYDLRNHPEMVKARLLGSAVPVGTTADSGHGLVDALHAVRDSSTFETEMWTWGDIAATGGTTDLWFPVPAGYREVRVFLTWLDPPSLTTEVVDDLDFAVWDSIGTAVGSSTSFDDNVEWARIAGGASGWWRVRVSGWNVPQPPARFGIYAAAVLADPAISVATDGHAFCAAPGQTVSMEERLLNAGHTAVASQMKLDLPGDTTWFRLDTVTLRTADAERTAPFADANLKHDATENTTELMTGSVYPDVPRQARWNVVVGDAAPEEGHLLLFLGTAFGQIWWGDSATITVDRTPPSGPSGLWSATHPVGYCGGNLRVTMDWAAAWDGGCGGLGGYGASWSEGAPAMPATTVDLGLVTESLSNLRPSHNARYYNLRPVDGVGNWSGSYASYGPIFVDLVPGEVLGLTLERSGSDLALGWDGTLHADAYHLYADSQPQFPHPTRIGGEIAGTAFTEAGGASRSGSIWYYRVRGTNFCGAEGQ